MSMIKRPKILNQNTDDLKLKIRDCTSPRCNADCSSCERIKEIVELINYVSYFEQGIDLGVMNYNNPNNLSETKIKEKSELINFSEFNKIVNISKLKEEGLKQLNIENFISAFNYWLKTISSNSSFNYEPQDITLKQLGDLIGFTFDRGFIREAIKLINEKEPKFILSMATERKPNGESFINLRFN